MARSQSGYDFVIIGAGSAGCVMADYLSRDGQASVLVVEAGDVDWWPMVHMPAGMASLLLSGRYNWRFETVPQKHLNGRRIYIPQGKGIGGSSSINGMIYTRGSAADYDAWAQMGCTGWGFADVLPHFKEVEDNRVVDDDEFHGHDGPLQINNFNHVNELSHRFIEACVELGLPRSHDFNGARQEGAGLFSYTMRRAPRSLRWGPARAFLGPARKRANVTVLTRTRLTRIVVEKGRARAVELLDGRGQRRIVTATCEVVLSAGAFHSPAMLLASGIGPADELRATGIDVVHDVPGVGRNLQDHLDAGVLEHVTKPITYDGQDSTFGALRHGIEYLLRGTGPVNTTACEAAAYTYSRDGLTAPDLSMHFLPVWVLDHGRQTPPGHGMTLHNNHLRPYSRGSVTLASADPLERPLVDPNYLSDPADYAPMIECVRWGRRVFETRAFADVAGGPYLPGNNIQSDAEILDYIRAYAETDYHPVGSCKMGVDPMAVVDPRLRVHGVEGLRVADSSIMPNLTSSNTNAPTIMIGTKAAHMMRADHDASALV